MWNRDKTKELRNRPSKQNAVIFWVFFLTFGLNLAIFFITFEINRGIKFFTVAESHYKGLYLDSVTALLQYTDTQSDRDYENFNQNLNRMFSYKNVFEEASRQDVNFAKFRSELGNLGVKGQDSFRTALTLSYLHHTSLFSRSKFLMSQIIGLSESLDMMGEEIHRNIPGGTFNNISRKQMRGEVGRLDDQISGRLTEFSDEISLLSDKVYRMTEASAAGLGLIIVLSGVYGAKRVIRRSEYYRKSLEQSEANLRLSMEQLPVGIWTTNRNLNFLSIKGTAASDLIPDYRSMIGKSAREVLKNRDFENLIISMHENALRGVTDSCELKILNRYWYSHVEPFRSESGDIIGVVGIAYDITYKKRYEESILNEKERLLVTLQSIGDAVITTNSQGKIGLVNPVAEKLTGWKQNEAEGKPLSEVFSIFNELTHQTVEDPVTTVIKTGGIVALENHTILKAKDGKTVPIADSGAPIRDKEGKIQGIVLVFRDVTQEHDLLNEIQKQMKIESLGLLAGGIAHDFNNLLTAILGNVSLAKMESQTNMTATRYLEETEKATLRGKDLASQLLTLSKGNIPKKKIISIKPLLEDSTRFALRGSNILPRFHIPGNLWEVMADPGQVTQVIHNLVINAKQAMPAGGTLDISAKNEIVDEHRARTLSVTAGLFVSIRFKDNGHGIPEDNLTKIFDPFFTTKEKGSGLGLFSVFSILKNHDGAIMVESHVGSGAAFIIYFPAIFENTQKEKKEGDRVFYGTGRILLMEDNDFVRNMAIAMLQKLGYESEFVKTGEEALEMYKKAEETKYPYRAVIMNLTVADGKGGKEAIKELLAYDPNAVAIVSSGNLNDPVMACYQEYGFKGRLAKPYRIEELSGLLNQILYK